MFALSTLISNLTSPESDNQKKKDFDQQRAAQVLRMRAEEEARRKGEEERKKIASMEIRAKVIPHLKRADQHIKNGRLDLARQEVQQAKQIDPLNIYVHALEERITTLTGNNGHSHTPQNGESTMGLHQPVSTQSTDSTRPSGIDDPFRQLDHWLAARDYEQAKLELERISASDPYNLSLPLYRQHLEALRREIMTARFKEESRRAKEMDEQRASEEREQLRREEIRQETQSVIKWVAQLVSMKAYDQALEELAHGRTLDPTNRDLLSLEERVRHIKEEEQRARLIEEAKRRTSSAGLDSMERTDPPSKPASSTAADEPLPHAVQPQPSLPEPARPEASEMTNSVAGNELWIRTYGDCLKLAWSDGIMGEDEKKLIALLRACFGISDDEHAKYEQEAQWSIYLEALVFAWLNGAITPSDSERLDNLRMKFHISAELHLKLERKVRHEILQRGVDHQRLIQEVRQVYAPLLQDHDIEHLLHPRKGGGIQIHPESRGRA